MASQRAKRRVPHAESKSSPPTKRALHYKVVELSNVDEAALERALNEWCPRGWTFDGVQFAMRESSKRPSMAFVFFTREGEALPEPVPAPAAFRDEGEAAAHLKRLARRGDTAPAPRGGDPWARLQALAGDGLAGDE
jgi:hypothetical protein